MVERNCDVRAIGVERREPRDRARFRWKANVLLDAAGRGHHAVSRSVTRGGARPREHGRRGGAAGASVHLRATCRIATRCGPNRHVSSSSGGERTRAARTRPGSCGRSGSRTSAPSAAESRAVVAEIDAGTFGNAYKGSSLETVVGSIAEQRQIFKGADHAFLWKPKLRIPDIYENRENQLAFARFLDSCACCDAEEQLVAAIRRLDARRSRASAPRPRTCSTSFIPRSCRRSTPRS